MIIFLNSGKFTGTICVLPVSIRTSQLEELDLVLILRNSKLLILAKCYSILIYTLNLWSQVA
jgi:hypothetical protein